MAPNGGNYKCKKNCKIIFFRMDDGRSHASSGTKRENKLVDKEVEALIEVITVF